MVEEISNKTLAVLLVAIIFLILGSTGVIINFDESQNCHTETVVERLEVYCGMTYQFSHDFKYICEEGIEVRDYEVLGHNIIYGCLGENEGICLIEKKVEVCD